MKSQNEHISLLTNLLPQYRLLNSLYQQVVDSSTLRFDSQCQITDFYEEYKDKEAFEKAILNLLLSADKEKLAPIVSNLRTEITQSIEIYIKNKEFFIGIDTRKVYSERYNPLKIEIEGQLKDTNELRQELTQVRNSLESASWKNDKIATRRLTTEEERLDNLYKREQEKLEDLYWQQKESDNIASRYIDNVFGSIYELSNSFLSLLDNYFPIEKEKKLVETKPVLKQGSYFDMKLVSLIHNKCNNIQFENLSEIDLYSILNLHPTNSILTVKTGERTRMCYLIYKLYEYLKTESRTEWRTAILKSVGIEKSYYNSKYKEPISEVPSRKSETFAQHVDILFANY
ncbi:hypothetical protein [Parabacteroides sp. PF5-9]|uniref:hypothetical protein n=1 Tax=Parabacteroides sp. PF5-9 TaxID=1742404 RepID=UPI00247393E4|nr:hypothetical protein [Parabacteroides sp. PF5-9]MDH6357771.1 hypothetical protein [Parabacteroides sp. PF5-9]